MPLISPTFDQAIAQADFGAIRQSIVDLIVQKQGAAFSAELSEYNDLAKVVSRLLPMLQRWDQEQLAASGINRAQKQLEQLCVPAVISSLVRFAPGWYGIQGCRPSPDPVEIVILTIDGQWILHTIEDGCFRYQVNRHPEGLLGINYSFVGILRFADCSGIHNLWVNGTSVPFSMQNMSEARYVDQIDDLLFLFQQAQVPLDCLPDLIPQGPFELVKILREPLRSQDQWADWIRQEVRYGPTISDFAHTTVVIPLYRLWHPFMQGHLAAFSMDPSFLDGRVEVMYVVDDPSIEHQILNWAGIYLHDCPYPVRIVSLIHNFGFGMACNIGVNAVQTERVVLMNSDVMPVRPGWLETMRTIWASNPTALLSGILLYDNYTVQHAGMTLAFSGSKRSPIPCNIHTMKGVSLKQFLKDSSSDDLIDVYALTGALLAFNRDLFLALGGFDPIFGRGDFEDLDLSLRWKEKTGALLISQTVLMVHLERQTMNVLDSEKRQWQERFNACCSLHLNQQIQQSSEVGWS